MLLIVDPLMPKRAATGSVVVAGPDFQVANWTTVRSSQSDVIFITPTESVALQAFKSQVRYTLVPFCSIDGTRKSFYLCIVFRWINRTDARRRI